MDGDHRERLVGNVVNHLGKAKKHNQMRQIALFFKMDRDCGRRIAKDLGLDVKDIERPANMNQEERAKATGQGSYPL